MMTAKRNVIGSLKTMVAVAAAALVSAGVSAQGYGKKDMDQPVAAVGEKAPDFTLVDVLGKEHSLSDYTEDGKIVVLEWFNPGCPFVVKHYRDADSQTMNAIHKEFKDDGVVWLRVNSGAEGKQGAGKELNLKTHGDWNLSGPILLDETGKVGKMYGAKRTPEMYIIGTDGKLHYHGAIDDNPSGKLKGDEKNFVRQALRQILAGETVTERQTRPYGCSVKYAG